MWVAHLRIQFCPNSGILTNISLSYHENTHCQGSLRSSPIYQTHVHMSFRVYFLWQLTEYATHTAPKHSL